MVVEPPPTQLEALRVLVADDDEATLRATRRILERFGCEVTAVASAREALACITGPEAIDLLVTDIVMPEMDGIELCRRIRTVPGYEDKPILMLTAKTDSISIEKAFAAGANDYIAKPFNLKDIYNRIRVAERLLVSSKTIKRIDASDLSKEGTQVAEDITLTDKVFLANVGRLILSFSLGNYITQLDRSELECAFSMQVLPLQNTNESAAVGC